MKLRLAFLVSGFLVAACGAEDPTPPAPTTRVVTVTANPSTTVSTTSAVATSTSAELQQEQLPVPGNVNQPTDSYHHQGPVYDTRTSGEIQFEWGCMQGYIDASTCTANGYGHVVPSVGTGNYDGLANEGEITRRFWECMEAGGDEISCRQ